jgi:hypothetical protein
VVAPPADLPQWVASHYQVPIYRVLIDGLSSWRVLAIGVELGYDQQSAAASLSIASPTVPAWRPGQTVEIWLGYAGSGGGLHPVFTGEIEDVDLSYFPHRIELAAAGYLRRTQPRYAADLTWSSIEDGALWVELLRKSGVPRYQTSGQGEGIVYGTRGPVTLRAGEPIRDLIDRLDQSSPTGMRTYELGGIVLRTPVLGVPAGNPSYSYGQGAVEYPSVRVLAVDRTDTTRDVANRCVVTGLPQADGTAVFADRRADSPYVPPDADGEPRDVVYTFSSDLLETREQCDALAQRYLIERNKRTDQLTLRSPLNPYLIPGRSLGLTAEKLGMPSARPFWIRHVRHSYDASGAWTDVDLEGGAGETGYLIGLDPIAAFTYTVSSEAYLVGGVPTRMFTAVCDGSASFDPDGSIAAYAWSTSTGASGSGVIFTVGFTQAQWDAGPAVTLTVTDHDADPTGPHTGSFTDTLAGAAAAVLTRTIYVAAGARADCTPDGGATWASWAPGGSVTVRSTPEIAPLTHSYFGLSDGRLVKTSDGLASAPELVHTFGASVECIWVNEANAVRVWVGLANGQVWSTVEADLGAEAGWVHPVTLPDPVNWLVESYLAPGQVRACSGTNVYITDDGFGSYGVLSALPDGTCMRVALSFFGNHASGASTVPVVAEDRTPVAFPGTPPADVRITAFADREALLAVDETGQSWVATGGGAFVATGALGLGACGHVVRDGEQTAVFYAACAEGVAKTYDAGASWHPLTDYAGTALVGVQIGYGAAPMVPPRRMLFVERTSEEYAPAAPAGNGTPVATTLTNPHLTPARLNDEPPAGWMTQSFDDTIPFVGYGGVEHTWQTIQEGIVGGQTRRYFRASDATAQGYDTTYPQEQYLFRHKFTIPDPGDDGPWATAMLETYALVPGGTGTPGEVYVNGTRITFGASGTVYIDPALLVADGTTINVIACRAGGTGSYVAGHRAAWKLTLATDATVVSLSTGVDGQLWWRPTGECRFTLWGTDGPVPGWNDPVDPAELTTVAHHTFDAGLSVSNRPNDPGFAPDGLVDGAYSGVASPGATEPVPADAAVAYATWRHPIRLPPSSSGGPYRSARLRMWKPNPGGTLNNTRLMLFQLNGQTIDVPDPPVLPDYVSRTEATVELDPRVLIPDGWNLLCVLCAAGEASFFPWLSYLIRIEV